MSASIEIGGRFDPGSAVQLLAGERQGHKPARPEGQTAIEVQTADVHGSVTFTGAGVEFGARYFVVGLAGGALVQFVVRGRDSSRDHGGRPVGLGGDGDLLQPPVKPDSPRFGLAG